MAEIGQLKRVMRADQTLAPATITVSPWLPMLLLTISLFFIAMGVVNWLAYQLEGATNLLYLLPLWLGAAAATLYLLLTLPKRVTVHDGLVTLVWWWRVEQVDVDAIVGVDRRRHWLRIQTVDRSYSFRFTHPNMGIRFLTFLEEHVPTVALTQQEHTARDLPLTLRPRLMTPIVMGSMALVLVAVGLGLFWGAIGNTIDSSGISDRIGMGFMGLLMIATSALFLYILLTTYIWRITFDIETITLRHTWRRDVYNPRLLTKLELVAEERVVKGVTHQVHQLRLHFMDKTTLDIAPNLPNFPMDYASLAEERQLTEVKAILEQYYLPVVKIEVAPYAVADEQWSIPQAAYQWQIRPYDLTVTWLDYGEHHAGASTIHILIDHTEAGTMRFRTTNGEVRVSPDGSFVVLHDATLLILFHLANGRLYHRTSRRGWFYGDVQIVDDELVFAEWRQGNPQQQQRRNPVPLATPTSALRRGLGEAVNGTFPSAYR